MCDCVCVCVYECVFFHSISFSILSRCPTSHFLTNKHAYSLFLLRPTLQLQHRHNPSTRTHSHAHTRTRFTYAQNNTHTHAPHTVFCPSLPPTYTNTTALALALSHTEVRCTFCCCWNPGACEENRRHRHAQTERGRFPLTPTKLEVQRSSRTSNAQSDTVGPNLGGLQRRRCGKGKRARLSRVVQLCTFLPSFRLSESESINSTQNDEQNEDHDNNNDSLLCWSFVVHFHSFYGSSTKYSRNTRNRADYSCLFVKSRAVFHTRVCSARPTAGLHFYWFTQIVDCSAVDYYNFVSFRAGEDSQFALK